MDKVFITPAQQFETPAEALKHYGVKGMQWGVRKADRLEGVPRSTNKEAYKDAQEFARAKMFYGQGAGTRRKLIKAQVEAKSRRDPAYKKAFDHHLNKQDLGKHAVKAKKERRRKDAREGTAKAVRGANRQLNGGFGPVGVTGAALAAGYVVAKQNNVDQILKDAASTKYSTYKSNQHRKKSAKAFDEIFKNS